MLTRLDPPLPLETSRGRGLAHFVIDYGAESDLLWVVFMDADGACWTVPNPEIRMQSNWSLGRPTRAWAPMQACTTCGRDDAIARRAPRVADETT